MPGVVAVIFSRSTVPTISDNFATDVAMQSSKYYTTSPSHTTFLTFAMTNPAHYTPSRSAIDRARFPLRAAELMLHCFGHFHPSQRPVIDRARLYQS